MISYTLSKESVDIELLTVEIANSQDISQSSIGITFGEGSVLIWFETALTQDEQTALAALVTAHDASEGGHYLENVYRRTPKAGPKQKEEWFEDINVQAGTLSKLAKRITYTNSGSNCIQYVVEKFFKGGLVSSSETFKYYTDSDGNYIEQKVTT